MSVNLMLFIIWILSGGGHPWFVYPLLGWGVALGVHSTVAWTSGRSEDELEPPSRPALPG